MRTARAAPAGLVLFPRPGRVPRLAAHGPPSRAPGPLGASGTRVSERTKILDATVEELRQRSLDGGPYPYLWLDAMVVESREGGRVESALVVMATGANADGHREILGLDVVTSEDGAGWLCFLHGLLSRGLGGVQLVVSDAHPASKDAIAATFPGASWQRCRTHVASNLQTKVPRSAQQFVASLVRTIFQQPDAEAVRA